MGIKDAMAAIAAEKEENLITQLRLAVPMVSRELIVAAVKHSISVPALLESLVAIIDESSECAEKVRQGLLERWIAGVAGQQQTAKN